MQARARSADRPHAVLSPIVPLPSAEARSWFGGKPRLAKDTPWPEHEGTPLRFLCQIDLAGLPAGLWSAKGPRDGWLAIFLHPEKYAAEVLHVRGDVGDREGPGQADAQWARLRAGDAEGGKAGLLPRWPVRIQQAQAGSEEPRDCLDLAPWQDERLDLANPASHPFDKDTLGLLLGSLEEFFANQAKLMTRFPTTKKLRQADMDWMIEAKTTAFRSLEEFYRIEAALAGCRYDFDRDKVAAQLPKLAGLPIYEFEYLKDDEDGFCCLRYRYARLCEAPVISRVPPSWRERYTSQLYWHCVNAYAKNPAILPPALRERMEQVWREEARRFHGAMGHAPEGYIYTPHGPDTDTEVLLELPTSRMQGWIWGDCYSIVLLIERQALVRGDFAQITIDITN